MRPLIAELLSHYRQAQAAGGLGIVSSLIGGAGALSTKYLWMQQNSGGPSMRVLSLKIG
jgi:hypothetical protein